MPFAGEIAALATSFFWAMGPLMFALAGRELGSVNVNRLRLLAATLMLLALHWALTGHFLPVGANSSNYIWLTLSGLVGLVIGDSFLFQALIMLGARVTMLIFSLAPIMASVLAWFIYGETLEPLQIAGIAVTLGGVTWVVSERSPNGGARAIQTKGLLIALAGAAGQAGGLLLARKGLDGDLPSISGHLIRLGSAALIIWIVALLRGSALASFRAARAKPKGSAYTLAGSVLGPLIGVWLSLVAIRYTSLGVASTLMALPPLFLLPVDRWVFGISTPPRAVWGTFLALAGVALLFLS
jgi:drug/metabolite transporter (DMT)-like permease